MPSRNVRKRISFLFFLSGSPLPAESLRGSLPCSRGENTSPSLISPGEKPRGARIVRAVVIAELTVITNEGVKAAVSFAGLDAPGEFQFNVVVPSNLANGEQSITAIYRGQTTQAGTLITIQN
jgi:uncharacterized protein (TIGR03437 family)